MPTPQPAPADTGTPRQAPIQPPSLRRPAPANLPPLRGPVQGIARLQADMARSRSERPARIAAQRQAALYRELACEGRA
ncbi:MAG: hypothetical protein DI570_32325 [Phenylobacterium zucineum]|nr:MAG: hypothetical protein DI570_32325 [Phenylobacterium zucineum]